MFFNDQEPAEHKRPGVGSSSGASRDRMKARVHPFDSSASTCASSFAPTDYRTRNFVSAIHPNRNDPIFGVSLFFDKNPKTHFRSISRRDYKRYHPEKVVTLNASYEATAAMQKRQVNRLMTPPTRFHEEEPARPKSTPFFNRTYKSDEQKMRMYAENKYANRMKTRKEGWRV